MKRAIWLVVVGLLLIGLAVPGCSKASDELTVATDATWPPFEYVNTTTNAIEGFDIDVMKAIAAEAGLEVQFVNVAWDPLLTGMAQGTYDMAISSITISEPRKKEMLFSDPYFAAGQVVVVRVDESTVTGPDNLAGLVGAQLGTTGAFEIEKRPAATIKTYDDIGFAFQDLMNGQIVAVVCDNPVGLNYVAENPTKLKIVGDVFTDEFYGIAVAKRNANLIPNINKAIASLEAKGTFDQIADKWLK